MRFKHGGLRRLILQFREQYINKFGAEPQVEKITELLNTVAVLRKDIHFESEGVSRAAVQGDQEVLPHAAQRLSDKVSRNDTEAAWGGTKSSPGELYQNQNRSKGCDYHAHGYD